MLQRPNESALIHHAGRSGQREQTGHAQRRIPQPRRLPASQHPARHRGLPGRRIGRLRRVGQQDRPQPGHLIDLDGIELEYPGSVLALGFLAGAHSHHGQTHQPVQQPRIALHRTNPIERQRQYLAMQQTGPQLQLARLRVGVDAVASGDPARHADHDGVRQHRQRPGLVAGGRAKHDRADQQREFAQQFVHRVDQQHPGTQPLPGDVSLPAGVLMWRPRRRSLRCRSIARRHGRRRRRRARRCAPRPPRRRW